MNLIGQLALNHPNLTDVRRHCINFNDIEYCFLTRKHVLSGESKHNAKREGHESYKPLHIAHLFIGGVGVVIQFKFYSGSICVPAPEVSKQTTDIWGHNHDLKVKVTRILTNWPFNPLSFSRDFQKKFVFIRTTGLISQTKDIKLE